MNSYRNLKFGIGVIDMARERYLLNDEESTIHQNQIVPTTAAEKRQNWWFYYKTPLIVTILVVAALISIVYSVVSKDDPDYTVTIMTENTIPSDLLTDVEEHLELYAEDLNGDGEVIVTVQFFRFLTDAQSEYDTNELQASFVKFAADASSGDSMIFIYDDKTYDYLDYNDMSGFFGPVGDMEEEYYLWSDMEGLTCMELNHYQEEGVTVENVQKFFSSLKVSVRTQDGAAFDKEEKIEYRNACIEMFERLKKNEPVSTAVTEE